MLTVQLLEHKVPSSYWLFTFIDIITIYVTFTPVNILKLFKSCWLRPWTSDKLSPCEEITSCREVRGSLVKSNVLIDYEDMPPMNATFEMADDDISLVSRILPFDLNDLTLNWTSDSRVLELLNFRIWNQLKPNCDKHESIWPRSAIYVITRCNIQFWNSQTSLYQMSGTIS